MEENNKNTPILDRRNRRLFRDRTKHNLIIIPVILILACLLALPLLSSIQATTPLNSNTINPYSALSNAYPIGNTKLATLLNSPASTSMSLTGNMTVTGNNTLNGVFSLSNAQQVVLGSPLYANGTMTITGDKIELGKTCTAGGNITILGNNTSPAINAVNGTLNVGNKNTGSEVYFNITKYYQYVESYGGGYIGDWNNQSEDLIILNNDAIRVYSGELYLYSESDEFPLTNWVSIQINRDWFNMSMNVLLLGNIYARVNLWGNPSYSKANYSGIVNVTQMALNGEFPDLLIIDVNEIILDMGETPVRYLQFGGGTVFDSWGDWFAVGTSGGAGGVMVLNNSYVYMNSSQSIVYRFLKNDAQAAITLEKSSSYPTARMYISTTNQSVTGFGTSNSTVITNGGISTSGFSDIRNITKITQGSLSFQGNMLMNGNVTVQGDIGVLGYNKILSPLTVTGSLNINGGAMTGQVVLTLSGGSMVTDGEMSIDDGEMSILKGTMQMNSTGIYIYGATNTSIKGTITSTGVMEITGNCSIMGNIGISGYNYMQGNINILSLLSLSGAMVTDGDMAINDGQISILSGTMIMNSTGSYITGDAITVTGEVDFDGDATITGNIGISGYNYMQGNIIVAQLSLEGVMVTEGDMIINNGEISIIAGSMVMNSTGSFITSYNSITVTGEVDFDGDATITGNIGISGYNYMQGQITVEGYMNINNGLTTGDITLTISGTMETTGSMTITDGEISIPSGGIVMNSTGSYIVGGTITVSGSQIASQGTTEIDGQITMSGDIGISGYNYMEGLITVSGYMDINSGSTTGDITLVIGGTMETTGSMTITDGEISIPSGGIVMNSTGSYIVGGTITVSGSQIASQGTTEIDGQITMSGDIGISGYNYMEGLITVEGYLNINNGLTAGTITLNIDGTMETTGTMSITNGEMNIPDGHIVMNALGSFITGNTIAVTGDQIASLGITEVNGDITIQGEISISGYNYMQGNVNVGQLSLDGVMVTDGSMAITSGAISILSGSMTLNSTGSYIMGETITVTGTIGFGGDAAITGNIGLSGYNYMQGNVSVGQLSLDGVMVTDGDMSIIGGEIGILSGSMVLNSTGSFITGDVITVTGEISFDGDATITGDIELSGYNYMEGLITIQGYLNINGGLTTGEITLIINGTMETTGTMSITSGEINIPGVTMVVNSTGSFIMADAISVTGDQIASQGTTEIDGQITMSGDIGISGYNYMEGLITVDGSMNINYGLTRGTLSLVVDGAMETTGSMTIVDGEISIPDGRIVMNGTGSYITGDTITVTGSEINSLGKIEVTGDMTMRGDYFEIGGMSYIKGPVTVSGSLDINGGMMKGTGTIVVSNGYMQTVGKMKISNGVIEVLDGKIVMDSTGTYIGSATSITGDLNVAGTIVNSGLVSMSGNFQILTPLSITGSMVTVGVTSMGNLGAINGILVITGNVVMSGATVISGDNNVIGSMTITPLGVSINGIVGLTGIVHTTGGLPTMSPSTSLEVYGGSMMGIPLPHVALISDPLTLLALGILGIGSVYVVIRTVYMGVKERRTLVPRIRSIGHALRDSGRRLSDSARRISRRIRNR
ncbi:MAG: hypothetical protein KIH10_04285 [Candidatus Freyarchaeota archaeon]|nr:hypothetical protein [Candidatus Jordarchaeia archaeon]MBS7278909.1 hypothetical protein [Candidatus Jordarchaeia archaeon]